MWKICFARGSPETASVVDILGSEVIAKLDQAGHGADRGRRSVLLQAAVVAAAAGIAGRIDGDMPDLAGHPHKAMQHLAVGDDAAADTRASVSRTRSFDVATGAHPLLAERGRVGIVLEKNRGAQAGFSISSRTGSH